MKLSGRPDWKPKRRSFVENRDDVKQSEGLRQSAAQLPEEAPPADEPRRRRTRVKINPPAAGHGRPTGSMNKHAREAIAFARASGDGRLPHEILLDIARGRYIIRRVPTINHETGEIEQEKVELLLPSLEDMKDAAKAAAPYFAPKISTVEVITGVSDNELDAIIACAAAEAGLSVGFGGEGATDEGEASRRSEPRNGRRDVEADDQ
jgi:hypothetical protein